MIPSNDHRAEQPGPQLLGPEDAVSAVRLSMAPGLGVAIVVLACDGDHHLLMVLCIDGGTPTSVRPAVDVLVQAAEGGRVAGIVVAIVRPRAGPLSAGDARALAGLVSRCDEGGVDLLDVLLVTPRRWRSVWHLADAPEDGEDGDP